MWFSDPDKYARAHFAKALREYAESLPPSAPGKTDAPGSWSYIARQIEDGSHDGKAFYAILKDRLDLPPGH